MEIGENNIYSLSSEDLNLQNTENYHLSIEISPSKFCYSLLNTKNLEYIFFKLIHLNKNNVEKLVRAITSQEILKQKFSTTSVSYKNFPSTIIPNTIYKDTEKEKYLDFIVGESHNTKSDIIHLTDSTIVYSVNESITSSIKQIQSEIIEKNSSTIFISQLIKQYGTLTEKSVFLYIQNQIMELVVLEKGKLIFHNYFKISSETDMLYYTLFCFDQLQLNNDKNELYLFGNIEKGDENYSLLYDYVRNIKFGEISDSCSFNKELRKVSKHQNFSLFSQVLCV